MGSAKKATASSQRADQEAGRVVATRDPTRATSAAIAKRMVPTSCQLIGIEPRTKAMPEPSAQVGGSESQPQAYRSPRPVHGLRQMLKALMVSPW